MTNLILKPTRLNHLFEFDRIFDNFFGNISNPISSHVENSNDVDFSPNTDIIESNDDISLTFELPGMKREDIKVSITNNLLTISGNRDSQSKVEEDGYIRREISKGSFNRSFTLPKSVNREKIKADYKSGLLTVKLAKLEEVKPKEINIDIS